MADATIAAGVEKMTVSEPGAAAAAPKETAKGGAKAPAPAPALSPEELAEIERKYSLVRGVGEECISEAELRNLLTKKPTFRLYDGFEPSGRMHIAQGVFKAMNVNKCTQAGGTFVFWVADWFALMNDKMGGDLSKIQVVGQYLIEVWKAAGMDLSKVEFEWCAEAITKNAGAYWTQALDIARVFNITRIKKCCQIMGRLEGTLTAAQILYPLMQCTDIFFLKADICQLGVDQRKVNMLAREYCDAVKIKLKPIILSHHMLLGLGKGQEKMSKSDPNSAIFMEDTPEEVERKIMQAYCPNAPAAPAASAEAEVEDAGKESMHLVADDLMNPCLDYVHYIIFSPPGATFTAGGTTFSSYEEVRDAFLSGKLSENDLKVGLAAAVNALIQPVREHFVKDERAKQIFEQVKEFKKDTAPPPKILRRLQAPGLPEGVPVHAVFAPWASPQTPLSVVLGLIAQLAAAPAGSTPVLWLPDWASFSLNCLGGDAKAIACAYSLLVLELKALAPELMETVRVIWQKEAILENPSDYWVSVINVGRSFQLQDVRAVDEANEAVGQVLSSLMHVGDVLALSPTTIGCSPGQVALHNLALGYYSKAEITTLPLPTVCPVPCDELCLGGLEAPPSADDFLLLSDSAQDTGKKLKKAFCEPGNVAHCPPLSVANAVVFARGGSVNVARKEENGGDKAYTTLDELRADYAEGRLHPADLKPALTKAVEEFLTPIRALFKTKEAKDADAKLKAVLKKMTKK